ncbi:MAG: thiolase family protein, partial [Deltaproteobacteria bacterium]|nr:thiolase family protein [Deltaproteobacteria bacterium]
IASLKAGLSPRTHSATTVHTMCSSGSMVADLGALKIKSGQRDIVVVGGMESYSCAPYMLMGARWGLRMGAVKLEDALFYDGFQDIDGVYGGYNHVAETFEKIIDEREDIRKAYKLPPEANLDITLEDANRWAYESIQKWIKAQERGFFKEVFPVEVPQRKKPPIIVDRDETPRTDTTMEKLAKLSPVFKPEGGRLTAGNVPPLNDGGLAMVMMSRKKVEELNLKPLGTWIDSCMDQVEPWWVGVGPAISIPKVLEKTGLALEEMDIIEINEASAAQTLFCVNALGLPREKVNVNGGAVAVGHPPGLTGARLILTALYALREREKKYAVVSQCAGGGCGMATVIRAWAE